ncbi:acyloxyacyl hydrolase [Fulvivirgaceae bacterium BMA10]|uniref:Acyloxyacyl hydrolase n=1 Tax=Splendidivirga corallicola TaxID=3051826 RepID=A0ABT8KTW0_9BACT|nr:acyloxyacyl hydrolase [Fulvivirgaceae bacterium BMA10]
MKSIVYLGIFFLIIKDPTWAQVQEDIPLGTRSAATIFGLKYHYGSILPHSDDIRDISDSNPWGFELSFSRLNASRKAWQKCNCYHRWGATLSYINFENPQVIGKAYTLVFFFEPILASGKRIELTGKAGMGLAYLTKIFDAEKNPMNLFLSTRLSFPLLLSLNLNYHINSNWNLVLSGYYNHISNGGIKQPNKGINFPTLALGIEHIFNPIVLPEKVKVSNPEKYSLQKYFGLFGTTRSTNDSTKIKQGRKPLIGVQMGVLKRLGKIYGINAGLEASYDGSFHEEAKRTNGDYESFVLSLMLGNNLIFGQFHFSQQFGIYFDPPTPTSKPVFQRYSLDYFILPKLKTGFSLKAHGHVAENIDIRIGVLF